jgi:hypothetical protein
MTRDEWLTAFAAELAIAAPTAAELDAILDIASVAAHTSERQAAPLSCWLVGRSGMEPAAAVVAARRVAGTDG